MAEPIGLYVHIPFCTKKCPYCDFYSVPYQKQKVKEYVSALIADMYSYIDDDITADTLYFGGGTPSLLSPQQISLIIDTAQKVFKLNGEITIEANPNTVNENQLYEYYKSGINRISFGMQSGIPRELKALGRSHSAKQAMDAVYMASDAGISNISLDLMLGTPYQTISSIEQTLALATSLPITHISAYMLKVEPSTPYWNSDLLNDCADDDTLADIYLKTVSILKKHGLLQYEISNFAYPEKESLHNLKYWKCKEYLGFGAAAHSFFKGKRYCNPADISVYLKNRGKAPTITDNSAGNTDELIMLGLRLSEGISLSLTDTLPYKKKNAFFKKAQLLSKNGFALLSDKRLALTPKGFLISNTIIADLL